MEGQDQGWGGRGEHQENGDSGGCGVEAEKEKDEALIKLPWRKPGDHAQRPNQRLLCCSGYCGQEDRNGHNVLLPKYPETFEEGLGYE